METETAGRAIGTKRAIWDKNPEQLIVGLCGQRQKRENVEH